MQAADRRHLHAGQQGVGDAGQRADAGRDQHQVEAQRQPLAQRQQLQRQQHRRPDHRGDVQAADRQQVGQARPAHRLGILLADRGLVAGGERGGDSAARCRAAASRMCRPSRSRSASSPPPGDGSTTSTGPIARPTPPIPWNQASRAKSWLPGSAIGGGGCSRARSRTVAPSPRPGGRVLLRHRHAHQRRQVRRPSGPASAASRPWRHASPSCSTLGFEA